MLNENAALGRLHSNSDEDILEIPNYIFQIAALIDNRIKAEHGREEIVEHLRPGNIPQRGLPYPSAKEVLDENYHSILCALNS